MDALVDLIDEQHHELRDLLGRLERQPAVTETIQGSQLRARRRVIARLQRAFLRQRAGRLRHLWPALARTSPEGREYVAEAWRRSRSTEAGLARREWLAERDPAATELEERIARGITDQVEAEVGRLPAIAVLIGTGALDGPSTAARMRTTTAPTRPHPDLPRARWVCARLQGGLARVDRVFNLASRATE